jgi:hypothetical protein
MSNSNDETVWCGELMSREQAREAITNCLTNIHNNLTDAHNDLTYITTVTRRATIATCLISIAGCAAVIYMVMK